MSHDLKMSNTQAQMTIEAPNPNVQDKGIKLAAISFQI